MEALAAGVARLCLAPRGRPCAARRVACMASPAPLAGGEARLSGPEVQRRFRRVWDEAAGDLRGTLRLLPRGSKERVEDELARRARPRGQALLGLRTV